MMQYIPSPIPEYIMHCESIKALVDQETIVIAFGGDGIPVFNIDNGQIEGFEAVIDKDFSAAKMRRIIRAQELWIISDIDNLFSNFSTGNDRPIKEIYIKKLRQLSTV